MDEKINLPCTPLRAIGEEGKPATIVDFQESYSAVEGLNCAITRGVALLLLLLLLLRRLLICLVLSDRLKTPNAFFACCSRYSS